MTRARDPFPAELVGSLSAVFGQARSQVGVPEQYLNRLCERIHVFGRHQESVVSVLYHAGKAFNVPWRPPALPRPSLQSNTIPKLSFPVAGEQKTCADLKYLAFISSETRPVKTTSWRLCSLMIL